MTLQERHCCIYVPQEQGSGSRISMKRRSGKSTESVVTRRTTMERTVVLAKGCMSEPLEANATTPSIALALLKVLASRTARREAMRYATTLRKLFPIQYLIARTSSYYITLRKTNDCSKSYHLPTKLPLLGVICTCPDYGMPVSASVPRVAKVISSSIHT